MKKYDLRARYRRRNPFKRDIKLPDAQTLGITNLVKDLTPSHPNHIWSSDFTYLNFHGSWAYVATIKDNFTKQILAHSFGYNHNTELVTEAYNKAIAVYGTPQFLHSDQGSEYRASSYLFVCRKAGIQISMSAKGCPYENGYQESFYNYFKLELGNINRYQTTQELETAIGKQIYYYNYQRIHSVIKTTPHLFRKQWQKETLRSGVLKIEKLFKKMVT
jgi:putative transposase